jgi:hypothetical protein
MLLPRIQADTLKMRLNVGIVVIVVIARCGVE